MTAPDQLAYSVKLILANREPSTHDPKQPSHPVVILPEWIVFRKSLTLCKGEKSENG